MITAGSPTGRRWRSTHSCNAWRGDTSPSTRATCWCSRRNSGCPFSLPHSSPELRQVPQDGIVALGVLSVHLDHCRHFVVVSLVLAVHPGVRPGPRQLFLELGDGLRPVVVDTQPCD